MTKYGVTWVTNTSTPTLTRQGSNTGCTYGPGGSFDSIAPWSGMTRCNVSDAGTVTLLGTRCYTDTSVGTMGQVMVQIPAFYFYTDNTEIAGSPPSITWWISNTLGDVITNGDSTTHTIVAGDLHPAFLVDGVAKSYAYVSAFEAYYNSTSGYLESKAGVTPTSIVSPITIAAMRGYSHRTTHWGLSTIQVMAAFKALWIVEYATLFSDTLGMGNRSGGAILPTGQTSVFENQSWGAAGAGAYPTNYRGAEHLWGNLSTFAEGCNASTREAWIAPQSIVNAYACDSVSTPYVDTGDALTAGTTIITNVFTQDVSGKATASWAFLASAAAGSGATYFCDSFSCGTGYRVLFVGGDYGSGSNVGLFYMTSQGSTVSNAVFGTRLQYMP